MRVLCYNGVNNLMGLNMSKDKSFTRWFAEAYEYAPGGTGPYNRQHLKHPLRAALLDIIFIALLVLLTSQPWQ